MGRSIKDAASDYFGGSIPEVSRQGFQNSGSSTASSAIQEAASRWERRNEPDEYQHKWNDEGDEYVSAAYAAVAKKKEAEADETGKKSLWERIKGFFTRDRAKNIGEAAISGTAAGYTGMERALYEAGQTGRTARYEEDRREAEEELARAKRDYQQLLELYNGDTSNRDVKSAQYVVDKWQREVDAYSRVIDDQVQQKATAATSELTHSLEQRSQKATEKAKEGLGTAGKIGVDAAVNILQMGGDALVGGAVGGFGKGADLALRKSASLAAMVSRVFGQGASEAEQAGATLGQQLTYGTTTAGIEYFTEKLFDGLAGLYGAGSADNITEAVIRRAASTPAGQNALRFILGMNEEGLEEVVSDILTPAAKMIYNGKNIGESYRENFNIVDTLYSYLIGAVASGGMNAVRPISTAREYQKRNAKNTQISGMYKNMNENPNVFREFRDRGLVEAVSEGKEIPKRRQARAEQLWNAYNGNTTQQRTTAQQQAAPTATVQQEQQQTPISQQSTGELLIRQTVSNMGLDDAREKILTDGFELGSTDAQTYAHGIREAFEYGRNGLTLEEARKQAREGGSFSAELTDAQFRNAWEIGSMKGGNTPIKADTGSMKATPTYDSIESFAQTFGTTAQAVADVYDLAPDTDVNEFAEGFRTAYDMGRSGLSTGYLTEDYTPGLTKDQRLAAYNIGKADGANLASDRAAKIAGQRKTGGNQQRVKGTVKGEGVSMADLCKSFNAPQNTAYRLLTKYAEATGVNIVLYRSQADSNGQFPDAQGRFQWKDNTIYIDLNSGLSGTQDVNELGKYTMMRTFAHEFTHFIEKWNARQYNEFREFVFASMEAKGENVNDLIENMQRSDASGNMTYEEASREVVADGMMDILPDSTLVQQLAQEHRTIFNKLLQKLREFTARLKQHYRGMTGSIPAAQAMKENGAYLDGIVRMWDEIAKGAVENYQAATGEILTDQPAKPDNLPKRTGTRTSSVQAADKTRTSTDTDVTDMNVGNKPETRPVSRDRFPANDLLSPAEAGEDLRQQPGVTRVNPVGRERFAPNDLTSTAEEAPDLRSRATQVRPVDRSRFPANDLTSREETGERLLDRVPKKAPQEAEETQEAATEAEIPTEAETAAQQQETRTDTPDGARLRARLNAENTADMNGMRYEIFGMRSVEVNLREGGTATGAEYRATIKRISGDVIPIEDARALYTETFPTREQAVDALVAVAENNHFLEEKPRKGSANAFANGDIFAPGAVDKVNGSKAASEIVDKMPTAAEPEAKKPKSRFPLQQWKNGTPSQKAAYRIITEHLRTGKGLPSTALYAICDVAFGGTQAEGKYNRKDAYDAMELAVNQYITEQFSKYNDGSVENAKKGIKAAQDILALLPTQNVRTQEQEDFQQFSTPPSIAYLTAWAANINRQDHVLEPSAGIGGLLSFAKAWGAETTANELSKRRFGIIQAMGFDHYFNENAEHIDNILPDSIQPTVVIMNPPFSSTAGRVKANKTSNAEMHISSALDRLADGGRLVAVVGRGMADDKYSKYWNKLRKDYTIRANIGIDGDNYKKYGTTFDVQIVVIDKTGPQGSAKTFTGQYADLAQIPAALEGIRNDRNTEVERKPIVAGNQEPASTERGAEQPVSPAMAEKNPSDGRRAESGNRADRGRSGESGASDVQRTGRGAETVRETGADERRAVEQQRSGKEGQRSEETVEQRGADEDRVHPAGGAGAVADVRGESGLQRRESGNESAGPVQVEQEASDDGVYATYKIPTLTVSGAKQHPATLVESAAMSAVEMPPATYTPHLPDEITKTGVLSDAQLVSVTYAGQAHEQKLPSGERRGFFIGDGTGVGKGRQIVGIILDNFNQGRKKAIWISEKQRLFGDAQRDWKDVTGHDPAEVKNFSKAKKDGKIDVREGIVYTTYDTLKNSATVGKVKKSNVETLAEWFGKDYDGVIVFDEAHNMGNLLGKTGRFNSNGKGSAMAIAAVDLQKRLPNARVVYASATAATEVDGLAFASRLGLWGKGTAFENVNDFVNKISAAGLSAMELVVRDMKAMGMYIARSISYNGVEYRTIQHDLDPVQMEIYNTMSRAWQKTMQNVDKSLTETGARNNPNAKAFALSQYYNAIQRFYNQVLTSMSVPSVIADMRKELAAGRSCVIQLVNTNQAEANRQIAAIKARGGELDEMDLTPRGTLINYLMNCYPVQLYEEYEDEDGKRRSRPVTDSKGNPVLDKKAVARRDALIEEVSQMSIPDGPLEMLFDAFGTENVAEVTGRERRVVPKKQSDGSIKRVEERMSDKSKAADVAAFQNGDKRILIFNDAGGTGASYHADNRAKNRQQRVHYVLQPGWRASKAVQGFGRTHRSNEASAPIYKLVTTNIKGQKRFTSTIARRLDQLGALTKGQRDTGSGMFGARDNLETDLARDSLREFYKRLIMGKVKGVDGYDVMDKLGFGEKLSDTDSRDISKFLNRILTLEVDEQNRVFDEFINIYEMEMDAAIQAGTLDQGMENVRADKIDVVDDKVIYQQKGTGAATHYVQAKVYTKPRVLTTVESAAQARYGFHGIYKTKDGSIRAVYRLADKTTETGEIVKQYKIQSPNVSKSSIWQERTLINNADPLPQEEWQKAWDEEVKKVPEYNEDVVHMLSGSLLPIWGSLPEDGIAKVQRLIADDGRTYLGRVIDGNKIDGVLRRFDVNRTKETYTGESLMKKALSSSTVFQLTYDRAKIFRSKVSGEWRLEYTQPQNAYFVTKKYPGMIQEKINWQTRFFIPTGEAGVKLLDTILENNPVANTFDKGEDTVQYSTRQRDSESVPYNSRALVSKDTVEKWLKDYAASNPNYAQAYITYMDPFDYLRMTTSGIASRQLIAKQSEGLTLKSAVDFSKGQPIQLIINSETGKVEGHEGRHRMEILRQNGIEAVPVLLFDSGNKYSKTAMERLTLTGQDFNGKTNNEHVTVRDVQPLSRGNEATVTEKFSEPTTMERISEKYGSRNIVEFSKRQNTLSNREVLRMAAEEINVEWLDNAQRNALDVFKNALDRLQAEQEHRAELGRQYKDQQFTKGGSRSEAGRLLSAMSVSDSKIKSLENRLLSLENKEILKSVLVKARGVVEEQERQRGKEALAKYRERRNQSEATRKYRARVFSEVETLRKWMMSPSNKDVVKHIPAAIQKTVADFLESINLISKTALRTGGLETTKADEKYLKNMKRMRDAIKENISGNEFYQNAYFTPEFMEAMDALIRKAEEHIEQHSGVYVVNQMSAAELKELADTLKTLRHIITTINRFHKNGYFEHVDTAAETDIEHLSKFKAARIGKILGGAYKFLRFDYMRPSYAFEHFGEGGKSIEHELRDGQAVQAFLANKIIDFAEETYTGKEVREWSEDVKTFELSDGEEIRLPVTHIMSLYCLNKRPQALTHIYGDGIRVANYTEGGKVQLDDGHLVSLDDVQKMVQSLTTRQIEVADALQKYMSTVCAEWGNYVSMTRFGVEQFGEENYFPINSDGRYLPATADESPDTAGLYALLNMSFTKEVKENAKNRIILYNIFDVFANHTASMTQYRSFALPVLDALKWFNYKNDSTSVRGQLSKAFGAPLDERAGSGAKGYAEQFVINLLRAYNGTSAQGDPYDTAALKFLHRYNGAAIAYSLRVVIQQPTAIARAAMILSPAKLTKGLGMSIVQMRKLADEMEAHSGIAAWKKLGFYDTNISRGLTELIKQTPSVLDRAMEIGTAGAEQADRFTWAAMWYAAKDSVKRSAYDSEEKYMKAVAELFEEVIYKTQVVDSLLTKAQFLRSKGGIARQLGSFMSEPSATMSMLADAHYRFTDDIQQGMSRSEAWQRNGANIAKTAGVYAVGQVILAAMQAVVDAWRDDDDKDPENALRNFLLKYLDAFKGNVIEEMLPFGKIPVVSELYETLKSWLDYAGVFDKLGLDLYGNDISSGLSMYLKYVNKAAQVITDKLMGKATNYTNYSVVFYLLRAVSNLSGLPVANAWRELQDVWNNTVGYIAPNMKLKTYERASDRKRDNGFAELVQQTGLSRAAYNKLYDSADPDGDGIEQAEIGPILLDKLESGELTQEQAEAIWNVQGWKTDFNKWSAKNGGGKSEPAETGSTAAPKSSPAPAKPAATPKPAASYDSFKSGVPIYGSDKKQATYAVWESQMQGSMTLDRFKEILSKADIDGNESLKQDELGYALKAAINNGEMTVAQASAVWDAQGWKHNLSWWAGRHQ